ncbi:MAG TPA: hypothetical protein VIU11_24805 [Nakamurella sp.]
MDRTGIGVSTIVAPDPAIAEGGHRIGKPGGDRDGCRSADWHRPVDVFGGCGGPRHPPPPARGARLTVASMDEPAIIVGIVDEIRTGYETDSNS